MVDNEVESKRMEQIGLLLDLLVHENQLDYIYVRKLTHEVEVYWRPRQLRQLVKVEQPLFDAFCKMWKMMGDDVFGVRVPQVLNYLRKEITASRIRKLKALIQ